MQLKIHIDGACNGNPGKCGIGVVIYENNKIIKKISEDIGYGTNNKAEYSAAIKALEEALRLNCKDVRLVTDSELLMKQLKGIYKVRSRNLFKYYNRVKWLIKQFENFDIIWVKRDDNVLADELASSAINKVEVKSRRR